MLSLRLLSAALLSVALGWSAPNSASADTITDIVLQSGGEFDENRRDFDILLNAVVTADLADALANPKAQLTVFAPNDRAFVRLATDLGFDGGYDEAGAWAFLVDALTGLGEGDPIPLLTDILLYHVVDGDVRPVDLVIATLFGNEITTLLGETFRPFFFLALIDKDPELRNPSVIKPANIIASNGRIHSLNRVLMPFDLP